MPSLNIPQYNFLSMPHKFRAFVAGYGCVHKDTLIATEHGFKRICEITAPIRVLSWNESTGKYQLSLSGGAFQKGRANLHRVSTPRGEFVSTAHHRIFSSDHKYRQVGELHGHDLAYCENLPRSNSELVRLLSSLDVQRYSQKDEDYLVSYANEARQYGQRFLSGEDSDLTSVPSQGDAHRLPQCFGFFEHVRKGALEALKQVRSRLGQFYDRLCSYRSYPLLRSLASFEVDQTLTLPLVHTSACHHIEGLSPSMIGRRHNTAPRSVVSRSLGVSSVSVDAVTDLGEEVYYDMQVLGTNNYVCADGFIHHNSGKTWVGCEGLVKHFAEHPKINAAYYAPTYKLVKGVFYPTFEEVAYNAGFDVQVKLGDHEVHLSYGGRHYGVIHCRTMDNPANIVGFKSGHALVDELDVLDAEKAKQAWQKILARMRYNVPGLRNGVDVTTTPEGFKFTYDRFKKSVQENPALAATYWLIQASTYDNAANLPDDYITTLVQDYPPQLIDAYLRGQFVNLTSGTIYRNYNREMHRSKETLKEGEPLFIGMDFNVTKMAATVYVKRNGGKEWHAVDEAHSVFDTPEMIELIKNRYPKSKITVYPDASGDNRKTVKASETDISLLRKAGFTIKVKPSNPAVKDRILAVNGAFHAGKLYVNDHICKETAECLEQQVYDPKTGEPDKKGGKDHQNDATGYPIIYEMPIRKPLANITVSFK